jgi:hypothetical protein
MVIFVGTCATGCEVFKLATGSFGGVRGVIVAESGEPVFEAGVQVRYKNGSQSGDYAGFMYDEQADDNEDRVVWNDFGDGRGRVLARRVEAFNGFAVAGALAFGGRPSYYLLRAGEFVVDHVVAGQQTVHVDATFELTEYFKDGPVSSDTHYEYSTVDVPVNVAPDQWTTVRIVAPPPRPSKETTL